MDHDDTTPSDAELLFRLTHDDWAAFRPAMQRYERVIYRVALAACRSNADAEEVVASTLLELWRKRDTIPLVNGSLRPWLIKVAMLHARNQVRSTRRYRRLLQKLPAVENSTDHADDIGETLDGRRASATIREAFAQLGPRDAQVLVLCVVEELSMEAAALTLGVPVGTVKSRLSRAKERLRGLVTSGEQSRMVVTP